MSTNFLKGTIPQEIKSLFFIKIFTTYSFAVFYSTLLLYLTDKVGLSNSTSTGIVGTFISLNFILHFLGGYWGGTFVSNRIIFACGMIFEIIGLLLIKINLYLGLGVFLTGSGIYATSINAIMLQCYSPGDNKRELAAFWIYSGMNLGFLIGSSLSGYFYLHGQFNYLFGSAVITSMASLFILFSKWDDFSDKTTSLVKLNQKVQLKKGLRALWSLFILVPAVIASLAYNKAASSAIITVSIAMISSIAIIALKQPSKSDKNKVFAFFILLIAGIIFWSLFFIGPMGLTVFIKTHVNNHLMGTEVAPQWYNNINTIMIVVGGPLLGAWFKKQRDAGSSLSAPFLFSVALLLIGTAYAILPMVIKMHPSQLVSPYWVSFSYVLLTLGELCVGPVGVAMIGQLAPKGYQGWLLGVWSMNSGIATMLSKHFSEIMTFNSGSNIAAFSNIFNKVGWGAIISAVVLLLLTPYIRSLIESEKDNLNEKIHTSQNEVSMEV